MLKVKPEVEVNWSVMIDSSCKINLSSLLYGSSMPASTLPFLANIFFFIFYYLQGISGALGANGAPGEPGLMV